MKVLQINSVCGIGSTGRICTDIADTLKSQGHECRIAYGRDGFVPEKYRDIAVRIGTDTDVRLHALRTRLFDDHGFGSRKATEKFIEWVKEYDPDVIHLHNIHGYYINIEVLFDYLKRAGKPIVWTLHDCWAFTGHCTHFDYIGCTKWRDGGCYDCPQKKRYPSSVLVDNSRYNYLKKKLLFSGVEKMVLITPSEWLSGIVRQSFLKQYAVSAIPNGIDLDIFKPTHGQFRERYSLQHKNIVLGVASVWDERKGLEDFIELSKSLDDTYKIVLVGVSNKQRKGLPPNILGIERTNSVKELAEIYTAADVFINPSKEETMGMTTLEALACGTPVIVCNKTAVPEVVDSSCGVVVGDAPTELYRQIESREYTKRLSEQCIHRAQKYEKKAMYDRYMECYREFCNR